MLILIADDDELILKTVEHKLLKEGFEVILSRNGKEAIELVKNGGFDLIIMDIRMPEMDGIETLGKVITMEKKIPVIIYTAYSNYKSNFMTWTADAYLTKSSNLDELKKKISELLS